jgi:hypothetical protein
MYAGGGSALSAEEGATLKKRRCLLRPLIIQQSTLLSMMHDCLKKNTL